MKWKDKSGKEVGKKEFIERFKKGVAGVTPLQQTEIQLRSTWIMIFGLLAGIVVSIYVFNKMWWVFIILVGALGNTSIQQLGLWQKKVLLQNFKRSIEPEGGKTDE